MNKYGIGSLFCTALAAMLSGCYTYTPPAEVFQGDTFTKRAHSATNAMLDDIDVLSLERAQQIALINNPDYISAYHAISAARMRYYQAMGQYSPVLSASFNANQGWSQTMNTVNVTDTHGNSFSTTTGVGATWLLFDGLNREFALLQSQHELAQQQLNEEDVKRLLMRAVTYAYSDILSAIANRNIAEKDLWFQKNNLEQTQVKFDAGTVPLSDVLNFKVLCNQASSSMMIADYNYAVSVYALAVLMGYPEGILPPHVRFPKLQSTVEELVLSGDTYLDIALANRPDLKSYREAVKIAEYQTYRTYSAYSPSVSAYTNFNYNTSLNRNYPKNNVNALGQRGITHTYSDTPQYSVGMNANWTLFNGAIRYNQMREAQAVLAQQEFVLASQWLTVVNEVRGAYANYINQVKQAKLYAVTLQLVIRQRDLVQEEYTAGNCELTRLNEAETNLVQAQTNLVTAMVSVYRAKAQLEAAVYGKIDTITVPADPEYPNFMDSINLDTAIELGSELSNAMPSDLQRVTKEEKAEAEITLSGGETAPEPGMLKK